MPPDANNKPVPGRPRALDDAKRREVCALISVGTSMVDAARYVGCAVSTVRREALRNEAFSAALQRAYLGAELTPLHDIRNAAKKYWRAGAWLLERTNPQRFAKQSVNVLKPEQLKTFISMLSDIVISEIPQSAMQQRLIGRLTELEEHVDREAWLAHREPCPPPRRARKAARRVVETPSAVTPQWSPGSHDEQ
jgi:hypothetical protein